MACGLAGPARRYGNHVRLSPRLESLALRRLSRIVAVACLAAVPARAQTLDEVLNELGPSATQIQAENLSGALYTSPRMIEILQAYGVDPAFQTTVDEARWVVRFDREDRELGKLAALTMRNPLSLEVRWFGPWR